MGRRTRPIIAAVLALAIAGLGHAYLRRWGRAVAWFAVIVGSGLTLVGLFADPSTGVADLPANVVYPIVTLFFISAIDAYRIASRQSVTPETEDTTAETPTCPNCGKELEAGVDFCPWCAFELSTAPGGSEESESGDEGAGVDTEQAR
jgi:hypothetical protein